MRLTVELHGRAVGELLDEGPSAVFRWSAEYWADPDRPVLGQWFEDGPPDEPVRGPGPVPSFFANLEPEGGLARWLSRKHSLGSGVFELLAVSGGDLPGAVRLIPDELERPPRAWVDVRPPATPAFGAPGLQLKVPMSLDRDDRLTLPLPGVLAPWLLKVPTGDRFRGIAENEAATLTWARTAGFDVPECRLHELTIGGFDAEDEVRADPALLVRRFDRTEAGPVHQEDLAQAQGLDPGQKYPRAHRETSFEATSEVRRTGLATVEGVARYASALLGRPGLAEYVRRMVFVVASGNGDAHLKNWSLSYPDRKTPRWSPLYDQVSTLAWNLDQLALPFYGQVNFPSAHREAFRRLGASNGLVAVHLDEIVDDVLLRLRDGWAESNHLSPFPEAHAARLRAHWRKHKLLSSFGPLS